MKSIYDQTCRSCGLVNSMIIYMPNRDGTQVHKLRIDHRIGDTQAKLQYLRSTRRDKKQSDTAATSWRRRSWSGPNWCETPGTMEPRHPAPGIGKNEASRGGASGKSCLSSIAGSTYQYDLHATTGHEGHSVPILSRACCFETLCQKAKSQ